jgi:hypothetical protein
VAIAVADAPAAVVLAAAVAEETAAKIGIAADAALAGSREDANTKGTKATEEVTRTGAVLSYLMC